MKSIWKYLMEPDFLVQHIKIQAGAEILSFGLDGENNLCLWALVDTQAQQEERLFACVGTGWHLDHILKNDIDRVFIGTVAHGPYVWHLFEIFKNLEVYKEPKAAEVSEA